MASGGLANKIIAGELRNSNLEMMTLTENLKANEASISQIIVPTTYIQGKKDVFVPYQTLNYYLQFQKDIELKLLDDLNHFVPWSNPGLIIDAIHNANQNK